MTLASAKAAPGLSDTDDSGPGAEAVYVVGALSRYGAGKGEGGPPGTLIPRWPGPAEGRVGPQVVGSEPVGEDYGGLELPLPEGELLIEHFDGGYGWPEDEARGQDNLAEPPDGPTPCLN